MIHLEDIHPLTEFQRHAKSHLARVNKTGRPEVLTVNGKAEAVLIGTVVYEQMVSAMEEIETLRSVRRGLDDASTGKVSSADEFHSREALINDDGPLVFGATAFFRWLKGDRSDKRGGEVLAERFLASELPSKRALWRSVFGSCSNLEPAGRAW